MPRAKASLLALVTAAAAAAALLLMPYTPAVPVQTARIQRGQWTRFVEFGGVVSSRIEPCISLQGGMVRRVHVQPGEKVKKGQLLFSLDTSAQESALAALAGMRYESESALNRMDESVAALVVSREAEWMQTKRELQMLIEAAQIRAGADGVVERLYVQEGQYTSPSSVMGGISDGERQIVLSATAAETAGMRIHDALVLKKRGEVIGSAVVQSISMPDEKQLVQITAVPAEQEMLDGWGQGEGITAQWLAEAEHAQALIPLSAVDAHGHVWVVENGRAYARPVDAHRRNGEWIAAGAEWENCRIVLEPHGLDEGCRVKEAKQQ